MNLSDAIKAIDYDPSPGKYPFEFRGKYHGTTSLLFAIGNEVAHLEAIKAKAEKLATIPVEQIYWNEMMEAKNDLLEALGKLRAKR